LGPIRRGNFVVVGARPDSGKTTFLLNEATYIASQLTEEQCILWLNNEEMGEKIGRRIIESGAGVTTSELRDDPLGSVEKYKKMVGPLSKIKVIYQSVINTREVEHWCKKYKPSVIIFDQLWKITGFEKDAANDTQRQTLLFAWARSLASQWGPVIVVHQLGGAAEGEKFPPMSDLYGSQTGIQGEADAIILIGRSSDPRENDVRFFSLPKNKMGDGVHVKPGMRNARFVLKIKPDIARYEDVGSYVVL
jgi:replicative DNA helicase